MIKSIKGKHGDLVFYTKNGQQYARPYKKPSDPKTEGQIKNRARFSEAIEGWKELDQKEKNNYRTRSEKLHMTGYNLFISEYMNRKEEERYSGQLTDPDFSPALSIILRAISLKISP